MDITNINLGACPLQYLSIGYVGETGARPVAFDFAAWAEEYGSGVLQLLLLRPGDANPYPVVLDIDGTTATWTPNDTATEKTGQGQAQLVYTVGGVVVKNAIFRVLIAPSLGVAGDPPEPYEDWLEQLTELAAETQQNALDAAESAEAAGTSAEAAAVSAGSAAQSALDAESAQADAEAAEIAAGQSAAIAREKAAEAAQAAQTAAQEADYAQQQRVMAEAAADAAHDSAESAEAAEAGASQAKTGAESAANAAAVSATAAGGAATQAAQSAQTAEQEASAAEQSAEDAAQSAAAAQVDLSGIRTDIAELQADKADKTALVFERGSGESSAQQIGLTDNASGRGSFAHGGQTEASGIAAHAEGYQTHATGQGAHAEGYGTTASGGFAHAEGNRSTASGIYSHSEGTGIAIGANSHAEGVGTVAKHSAQHVGGRYNIADPSTAAATEIGTYVEIIGNGTGAAARSNARTLDWDGNETLAGDLTIHAGGAGETTVGEALDGLGNALDEKAPAIYKTAGPAAVVTVTDGAEDMPLKTLMVDIEPVQDTSGGNPSPTHICPISGWDSVEVEAAGENLWGGSAFLKLADNWANAVVDTDAMTLTGRIQNLTTRTNVFEFPFKQNTRYTIFVGASVANTGLYAVYTDGTETSIATTRFVSNPSKTLAYLRFYIATSSDITFYANDIGVFEGNVSADAFKPYSGNRYTIQIGQTVYGGTLDVTNGTLSIGYKKIVLGASGGTNVSSAQSARLSYPLPSDSITNSDGSALTGEMFSDFFAETTNNASYNGAIGCLYRANGAHEVMLSFGTMFATPSEARAWVAENKPEILYKLATPIEIQLDPVTISTISNQTNNVWADAGDVHVEFAADLKTYIDKKIAAAVAALS